MVHPLPAQDYSGHLSPLVDARSSAPPGRGGALPGSRSADGSTLESLHSVQEKQMIDRR